MLGAWLRDVIRLNPTTFRLMGPDETASNRLSPVFEATDRVWQAEIEPGDDHLAPRRPGDGGAVRAPLPGLAGGLPADRPARRCSPATRRSSTSSTRWSTSTRSGWRPPGTSPGGGRSPSLNYLLTSPRLAAGPQRLLPPGPRLHRPRREQEGRRGRGSTCRRTPTRCCPPTTTACAAGNYVNVVVAGKQPALTYLDMDAAIAHCTRGAGIWEWASNDDGRAAGRGAGLRRRHPDAGDPGRGRPAAPAPAGAEGPGGQRGRPDAAADRSGSTRTG